MKWRPYWKIFAASARENSANPKQIIASVAASLFRVFLLASIYGVVYRFGTSALSYQNTVWSLAVYFAFILNLGLRDLFKVVEREVQSGEVELQLIKPLDWRLVKISQLVGKNGLEFILQLVIMPLFLLLTVGAPDVGFWSPGLLMAFALLTLLAVICASSLFMSIGLAAFWLNDAQSVYRLFDKAILVFGGGFVPIALLPIAIQSLVRYSPFGVYAAPTQLFNPEIVSFMGLYIVSALLWTLFLVIMGNIIWHRAQARIEVNGG